MPKQPILLIVDDERATREGLRAALEDEFEVYLAANVEEAKRLMALEKPQLVLTDLRLGADSGMTVVDMAMALQPPPVTVMMTAYGSVDTAVEAMRRGAWHFVTKPLNLDEVEMLLRRGLATVELAEENRELKKVVSQRRELKRLIGKSSALTRTLDIIEQVAPTRATVLIEGETGTGKEVVAHAIHELSGRPVSKFVVVHCAALSPQLLESELFGHEKGAFTGAAQRRIGRFEQADGGTVFLDEIGEIDAATQVKLLRVLSERRIERVGSNASIHIDVRVVAATNRDLKSMVERGEFREDLYFRLNVVNIKMPPLRQRGEDVVLLAGEFLREFAQENGRPLKPLSAAALLELRRYPWPGNVRELRTAIEHGVVMSNRDEIDLEHLPLFLQQQSLEKQSPAIANEQIDTQATEIKLATAADLNLDRLVCDAVRSALALAKGNRTEAAQMLGISRRTLQRKLREMEDGPAQQIH